MKHWLPVVAVTTLTSLPAFAEPVPTGVGAHIAFVGNDAAEGSDFDTSFRFEGFGQLVFTPQFAFEVGIAHSTSTEDSGEDNQGTYSLDVTSNDVFAGIRLNTRASGALSLYGRAGLLYYHSELDFAETFYEIKPGGELEEIEEGIGYYLEAGTALEVSPNMTLDLGFTYRKRQDYFEDSSKPFDMDEMGVTLGVVLQSF